MDINVYSLLAQGGFFMVNKKLAKSTSIEAALLLSDLISKRQYFLVNGDLSKTNGWFFNSQENIELDTTLTPHQQRKAIDLLIKDGYLQVKKMGMPATNYFFLFDVKILEDLVFEQSLKNLTTSGEKNEQPVVNFFNANNNKLNNNKDNIYGFSAALQNQNKPSLKTPLSDVGKKRKQAKKEFEKPKIEEVIEYFLEKGYKKEVAIKAFNFYDANEWKDSNGKLVVSWKQKMVGVWFKDENKVAVIEENCPYTMEELKRFRKLKDSDLGLPFAFDKKWEYLLDKF